MAVQKHLIIIVKNPRIGRVKTRLARDVGKVTAWRFYRHMVRTVPRSLDKKGPWKTWLAVTPDQTSRKCFSPWNGNMLPQKTGDLGQRMLRPHEQLPRGAFVLIGTDVVGIRPVHIRKAFKTLGINDLVFGPSEDGGFWLVGHKRHPRMINPYGKKVRWSHDETLNDCLSNVQRFKVGLIDHLSDVDDGASFMKQGPKCLTAGHQHAFPQGPSPHSPHRPE